jgi:hypothetical protein
LLPIERVSSGFSEREGMAAVDQRTRYVSLAPLCGQNSMEAFLQALTEKRRCMDCKRAIEDLEGAMAFSGQLPHSAPAICVRRAGGAREELRRLRAEGKACYTHPC